MTGLSAWLFGEITRPTDSKSMKVVKLFSEQPLAKRKETSDWYPNHNTYFALTGDTTENLGKEKGKEPQKRNSAGPSEEKSSSSAADHRRRCIYLSTCWRSVSFRD
uniref:Small ribosomal subunit protein mS33 n=1 Tax=Canis lupus familiaris TaxID=9615 RepID=A0A8C0P663_CANLF